MSTKFMKVCICDYCGKIEAQRTYYGYGDIIKMRPEKWQRICTMDLCPTCGDNFTKAMEGKNNA